MAAKKKETKSDPLMLSVHEKLDKAKDRLESVLVRLREAREIAMQDPNKLKKRGA